MLTFKAMYKEVEGAIHAEVLDFPGVITCGRDLDEARVLLAGALTDMAETCWREGESLPRPNPDCTAPEADLEEPIHLLLTATSRAITVPAETSREAA
jgi:predicted RNase H-like HicB family nuclease